MICLKTLREMEKKKSSGAGSLEGLAQVGGSVTAGGCFNLSSHECDKNKDKEVRSEPWRNLTGNVVECRTANKKHRRWSRLRWSRSTLSRPERPKNETRSQGQKGSGQGIGSPTASYIWKKYVCMYNLSLFSHQSFDLRFTAYTCICIFNDWRRSLTFSSWTFSVFVSFWGIENVSKDGLLKICLSRKDTFDTGSSINKGSCVPEERTLDPDSVFWLWRWALSPLLW